MNTLLRLAYRYKQRRTDELNTHFGDRARRALRFEPSRKGSKARREEIGLFQRLPIFHSEVLASQGTEHCACGHRSAAPCSVGSRLTRCSRDSAISLPAEQRPMRTCTKSNSVFDLHCSESRLWGSRISLKSRAVIGAGTGTGLHTPNVLRALALSPSQTTRQSEPRPSSTS